MGQVGEEVSCKALEILFKGIRGTSSSPSLFEQASGVPLARLRDPKNRISWPAFVKIMAAAGRIWPDEALVGLGESFLQMGALRPMGYMARLVFSPSDFFKWIFKSGGGAGNTIFTCVSPAVREIGPGVLEITMALTGGQPVSREFFWLTKGNMQGIPALFAMPPAAVEMSVHGTSATYLVHLPPGGGWLKRVWQALLSPFRAAQIARNLRTSNDELVGRYLELEKAKSVLADQAQKLETINELGQRLILVTDPSALSSALDHVLRDRMQLRAARVVAEGATAESGPEIQIGETGGPPDEGFPLLSMGSPIGRLDVWHQPGQGSPQLLSDFIPWVSIAYDHARSFQILEQRVAARTAELKTTNEKLDVALADQKLADQQRAAFFANASHELRTPLTLLIGPLERLARQGGLQGTALADMTGALSSAYRLLKLVNDVLDVSKIEAGKLSLRRVNTDLSRQLSELAAQWRVIAEKRSIHLTLELPPRLVVVADPERIDQVALNLISNSVRYTPDGGDLTLRAGTRDDVAWFSVENSGEGIDPEDVPNLFKRFGQSTHSRGRRFGSTGLGLAVVHDIVELHGGTITVENEPGKRVCFRVELPAVLREGEAVDESSRPSSTEIEQYQAGEMRDGIAPVDTPRREGRSLLLLVEDNPELSRFLVQELQLQYDLAVAGDGVDGLALAQKRHPDLILSDVMMPRMDGLEMCQALRADPTTRDIPTILLTARGDLGARLEGLEKGADDYVVKPFHMEEVKARIAIQLRLRKMSQEMAQRQKLAAIGTLVAGVAHEVRNPLNGIVNALGPVKEMLAETPGTEPSRELLDLALEAAHRVEEISSLLLQQSRTDDGELSDVKIKDNIDLALRILSHKLGKGPQIEAQLGPASLLVHGEPGSLNQVWVNLIDNAIAAAGPKGRVKVVVSTTDAGVEVSVADDGSGIPESIRDRIFDPFFTTKPVGSGTGLGLSLVRQIVSRQGGSIRLESGHAGTRFTVTLQEVKRPPRQGE